MKKIITAIGNPIINDSLKKAQYTIQAPDIQYKEDLLEVLKNKKDTEILILNETIIKEELINYIKKIKEINQFIKIIILLETENEEIKNILMANGIKEIFYGNKINIIELEKAINRDKSTEEILKEEIENLKEVILKKKTTKTRFTKRNKFIKTE